MRPITAILFRKAKLLRDVKCFDEPIMAMRFGRHPIGGPAEPLDGQLEAAELESAEHCFEGRRCTAGAKQFVVISQRHLAFGLFGPVSGNQRREIDEAGPDRRSLPIEGTDADYLARVVDEHIGGVELAM